MNRPSFFEHVQDRFGLQAEGQYTDFLSRKAGHLLLADQVDLHALVERYGAPLEVAFCPHITTQITNMHCWAAQASQESGYQGQFVYAYATKANFAEEVVRTAISSGAHYETSAAADVVIAHHLWRQGTLPEERYIFCNGSKDWRYIDAIVRLREAGYEKLVVILDSVEELDMLLVRCQQPLLLGLRERHAAELVDEAHPGGERFGLTPEEIEQIARRLQGTQHQIILYHAMIGSQMEDKDAWAARLERSIEGYCAVRQYAPGLQLFSFGGGMPTSAYALDFEFDYAGFMRQLMSSLVELCERYAIPQPDLVGEFGRYTVASHSVFLMEVGSIKAGQGENPDWFLLNGSLMVSLPDTLIVEGQQFIILPLEGWDRPVTSARLGGRYTCDSDDYYPRPGQEPLMLPEYSDEPYVLAFFGVGAYQQMISGRGGAHHCLTPEMRRIIIEQDDDALVVREIEPQGLDTIMGLLGYNHEVLEPARKPVPAREPVLVERKAARETMLNPRSTRRRAGMMRARVSRV